MYRVTNLFFLFLFLFNISMSAKTNIGFKKTLRVGWYEQFPFAYRKDVLGISTVLTGMDIELNRAIAKKVDFGLQFIETPWKTQLNNVERWRYRCGTFRIRKALKDLKLLELVIL